MRSTFPILNLVSALCVLTEISCYTFLGPNIYNQAAALPSTSRGWSNVLPYGFRSPPYHPSMAASQYYGRYLSDPYFTSSLQNPEYYYSQDNYPYTSSLDDGSDYYSNILYFIPAASRRYPYYDQPMMDPMDEMQDYEDEDEQPEEEISKSQRDWWLEKGIPANEEDDYADLKLLDSLQTLSNKESKTLNKQKSKQKESSRKKLPNKNRYAGIDGFGRRKDKELVFGTYKQSPRRDEERTWVYGVPVRSDYNDDEDVRELKSLVKNNNRGVESFKGKTPREYGNTNLANWIVGNAKRSANGYDGVNKENVTAVEKILSTLKPQGTMPVYSEGGMENFMNDLLEDDKWSEDTDSFHEIPSVFDKVKQLLALEDKVSEVSCYGYTFVNVCCQIFPYYINLYILRPTVSRILGRRFYFLFTVLFPRLLCIIDCKHSY